MNHENMCEMHDEPLFAQIGHVIPDAEAKAFHNEEIKEIKLADYRGKWLVLFFYPADFTFVCPTELEEMADNYETFLGLGAEVLSVSVDSVFVHKAWHDTSDAIKKVKFPMLSDSRHDLCEIFGTYIPEEGVSLRGTFVVDPDGILRIVEVNDNSVGRNAKELIRKIQAAKFVREHNGNVCPASWQPGDETLKPGLDLVGKI
jgi:peroxiredoxin (alkyl hydroperoxide reductase subunit C)